MKTFNSKTLVHLIVPLLIAAFSFFIVGSVTTTTEFHENSIVSLQERQNDVMGLAAASAAASAAVALVPGDATTPIANTLAQVSAGFMVVLSAIFLEKYLLVIGCFAAFKVLIPAACGVYLAGRFMGRPGLATLAWKLGIFGLILSLAVPVSVRASDYIHETYDISIEATLNAAQETTQAVEEGAQSGQDQEEGFWSDLLGSVTSGISQAADTVTDTVGSLITRFVEALAMTLVTCCAIPLLVLLLFWWSFKLLFAPQMPALPPRPRRSAPASQDAPAEQEEALV